MSLAFGPRRGVYIDISDELKKAKKPLNEEEVAHFETFDLIYRTLCALLYNYVPMSGHPGGSISSGRFVEALLFDAMDYDFANPERADADVISYAAGHKALGLYALWALRNEVVRDTEPQMLPSDIRRQLRLEDLIGFRRNPSAVTPLFKEFRAKALDGHPTPATPFVKLSTGASGVGVSTSLGLAYGAMDYYGREAAPRVHIVEGEGGMTPGRVSEAMAAAGTASLSNVIMHIDWNQASIDSNKVCRNGSEPGDYVQWTPMEMAYLHDWNVILVPDGRDYQQIFVAQRRAASIGNSQPTAIVYETTKGWNYGVEGRASHGAGHKLCSEGFFRAVEPLFEMTGQPFPMCEDDCQRCEGGAEETVLEECLWDALKVVRDAVAQNTEMLDYLSQRIVKSCERLDGKARMPRKGAPDVEAVYMTAAKEAGKVPKTLALKPGNSTTLRAELGNVLNYFNKKSNGALFVAAADLLDSTSVSKVASGFPEGYYNADTNPGSRVLSIGGICEDAMTGVFSGLSSFGEHIGVGSSYGAFLAALGHVPARLHAIGNQARASVDGEPYRPFILVCAHAGVKTGEDGPTHADPQALQLVQENFPAGTCVTLTPWDPAEIWTLMSNAFDKRPAVIVPFVTRPNEEVLDRVSLGLAPVTDAATGVYPLRKSEGRRDGAIVIQGSEVGYAFVQETLPMLQKEGIDLDVYYVASAELFSQLPKEEREKIFSPEIAGETMGITGFTLPTMYRWVRSPEGIEHTLHPFRNGHFLGSGKAQKVLAEAGLDGEGQFKAIKRFLESRVAQAH